MRAITVALGLTILGFASARCVSADDLIFGCWNRPTCGKVCKLVCDTKKLTVVGYGCKCNTIAVPGPSCEGCKHCLVECCPADACGPCGSHDGDVCCGPCCNGCCCEATPAKLEFCWHDWFTHGCAKPRTVKRLTKYQAEKEIDWYHWEVVDACECGCTASHGGCGPQDGCRCVYKPAPEDAQLGDVMEVTEEERLHVSAWIPTAGQNMFDAMKEARHGDSAEDTEQATAVPKNSSPGDDAHSSSWRRLAKTLRMADENR